MLYFLIVLIYLNKYAIADIIEPLYLTDYIDKGEFDYAREKALVNHEEIKNITSYSGMITVNKTHNSNTFFWFFPSQVIIYV